MTSFVSLKGALPRVFVVLMLIYAPEHVTADVTLRQTCDLSSCSPGDQVVISEPYGPFAVEGCPTEQISNFVAFEQLIRGVATLAATRDSPLTDTATNLPTDKQTREGPSRESTAPIAAQRDALKKQTGFLSYNAALSRCASTIGGHHAVVVALSDHPTTSWSMKVRDLETSETYWIASINASHPLTDIVGNLNGIKIRIPAVYRRDTVVLYAKRNAREAAVARAPVTLDTPIDTMSFQVRQRDFQIPINDAERSGLQKLRAIVGAPPPQDNRWLSVRIAHAPLRDDAQTRFEDETQRYWPRGPFNRLPDTWGLSHYRALNPPKLGAYGAQLEYFFAPHDESKTMIKCENTMRAVTPHDIYPICSLYFNLAQFQASVVITQEGQNVMVDFAGWKDFEVQTAMMLNRFIVH